MTALVVIPDEALAVATPAERRRYLDYLRSVRAGDPFLALGYEPSPRQEMFHAAAEYDVLYGGAAGGGKTRALVMEAIRVCVAHPGIVVGAFRRTYPELDDSLVKELAAVGYCRELGALWNATKRDLTFPNGSRVMFRYAESMKDATRSQGSEWQLLLIDERTLMAPDVVEFLQTRIRSGNPAVPVLGVRSATNPGGASHAEVKSRYVEATNHGATVYADERGREVRFIPARVSDNPHVNAEYEADLSAIKDPQLRKALRDGDWDVFLGQVFTSWNHDRHVVKPFSLPESWARYCGVDWGFAAPWAVLWAAQDEDRRMWVYREFYETKVGEHEQARRIVEAEKGDPPVYRVGDPAMAAQRGDAESITSAYETEGCHLDPANNDRLAGWQRIHSYLADGPACPHHRSMGWETCPMLHVFSGCVNLIRTLPALPYSRTRGEDADTNAEDHAPDSLRYLLMAVGQQVQFFSPDETAVRKVQEQQSPKFQEVGTFVLPAPEGDAPWLSPDVEPFW